MVRQQKDVTETTTVCNDVTKMARTQNKNPFDITHQGNHNLNIWRDEKKHFLKSQKNICMSHDIGGVKSAHL